MIAPVNGWRAVIAALLWITARNAVAADDPAGAARELARKTAGFAGRGEPVSTSWRNLSSLAPSVLSQARTVFEAALHDAGGRTGDGAQVAAQLTLSENAAQYLLVEEIRKADERQVWISAWKRSATPAASPQRMTLEKKLVTEQDEPILDVRILPAAKLVLTPSRLTMYRNDARTAAELSIPKSLPRDPRGLLHVNGTAVQAYLPGALCTGSTEPGLSVECRPSDEPWVLESGSRALLLAHFERGRNYFDGRVTTQTGVRKAAAPFYTAASFEDQGKTFWLLALVDGRTRLYDASFEAVDQVNGWGSDIAGVEARCGAAVLATRPGGDEEPDALQAFAIVNRASQAIAAPVDLPGPVTALWNAGGGSALAVTRNLVTGKYEAYLVTIACGD